MRHGSEYFSETQAWIKLTHLYSMHVEIAAPLEITTQTAITSLASTQLKMLKA